MINYISRTEDVKWLAYKLKDVLGSKISINKYGLNQEVLHGYYNEKGKTWDRENCIDFHIKYNRNVFLRIGTGEIHIRKSYDEKLAALKEIGKVIIDTETITDKKIGQPLAFYRAVSDDSIVPTLEWAFRNQEEYVEELKNGTIFDDATIENLIIIDPKMKIKK